MKKKDLVAYDTLVETMVRFEENLMKKGNYSLPDIVAKTIYKAATDEAWKLRYSSGKFSGTILRLRRLLPERVFLGMMRYLTFRGL